ncbi:MAG: hypothetical protein DMG97_02520 [Acidobacteria bacterium]|nr:MAG: hypothetical protein DMG97_02520 [Acidobacteriota bacterium]
MPLRGLRLSDDLKTRLEQAQKLRGYRSVNAFILEAIEELPHLRSSLHLCHAAECWRRSG